LEQRVVLRVVSVLTFLITALLVLSLPFFMLDFIQMRGQVAADGRQGYDLVSLKATATGGIMAAAPLALGIGAWRSTPERFEGPEARKAAAPRKIVVGKEG